MRNIYILVLLAGLLAACNAEREEDNKSAQSDDQPSIIENTLSISKQFGNCETDTAMTCTRVSFDLPELAGSDSLTASKINKTIKMYVLNGYLSDSVNSSFEDYANQFIEDYKTVQSKFGESFGWYTDVDGSIKRHDENLIVIEITVKMYTGGAHGTDATYYLNFDLQSGELLTLDDIFKPNYESVLNKLAHQAFQHTVSGENLEDYQFENNQFYNDNFGLLPEGMKFYYNAYEIAPYSSGSADILIPYNQLSDILEWNL